MADDAAGAVRRTPRPAAKPPTAWWSPTEGFWSTNDGPVEGLRVLDFADEFRAYPPPDAVELVGPDQRRPVVLLRADDCDCGPPYEDCPHGPEPVDALDLAVWLHAEALWQRDDARNQFLDHYRGASGQLDRIVALEAVLRERTAERNALRGQVATQEQVLQIVQVQTDDCVQQVDAALGHRYHTPGVHYSVSHVAEKAAAELTQLEAQRAAALRWLDDPQDLTPAGQLYQIRAELQGGQPADVIQVRGELDGRAFVGTVDLRPARKLAERLAAEAKTPGGFPYRQHPHDLCGSNVERQQRGDPGHCEDCCSVGHVVAHPDLGCGDVGCYRTHGEEAHRG